MSAAEPHWVYRLYATDDSLLYVGSSRQLGQRLAAHAGDKPWWSDVTRIESDRFETRQAALDAERRQILELKPIHNKARYRTIGNKTPMRTIRISNQMWQEVIRKANSEGSNASERVNEFLMDYVGWDADDLARELAEDEG